jgi:1-acyl-sn-glycerol-3-phosphate acyltransferase
MLLGVILAVSAAAALGICFATGGFVGLTWLWLVPTLLLGFTVLGIVLAFLFLLLLAAVVDVDKEQKEDSRLYRKTIELYLQSALRPLGWRITVKGKEKLPKDGRFLLVCNHVSLADPVVLLRVFTGRQLAFISKRENQSMFIVGKVMHKLLCQPINRENDKEALKTIVKCVQLIREDKASVAVFPEGYIHEDKKLHHFRPGVFKIAKKTEVPIVVCTLKNTKDAISNLLHLRKSDIEVSVLDVIMPEAYADLGTTEIAQQVYVQMAADLGPEQVAAE